MTINVRFDRVRDVKYVIEYNKEKDLILKETRGVGFEEVIEAYERGWVLDDLKSKNHPNQRVLVVRISGYIYAVPYVVDSRRKTIFLKTIYPSRVLNKQYGKERL